METLQPELPDELKKKWNWGAFLLGFIWGVPHRVWISLLEFVPIVSLIIPFYLGAYGNELAWKKGKWDSVEHFLAVQRKWAIAGVIVVIIGLVCFLIGSLVYLANLNAQIESFY